MHRYEQQHRARENWTKKGIWTAGFWSKWILWAGPTLAAAISGVEKRSDVDIVRSQPPFPRPWS